MEFALLWSSLLSTQVSGRSLVQCRPRLTVTSRLQVLIDLDQSSKLIRLRRSDSQCGIRVIRFAGLPSQITRGSASIARLREVRRLLSREPQLLPPLPELAVRVMLNQRVSLRWRRLRDDNRAAVRFAAATIPASLSRHSLAA